MIFKKFLNSPDKKRLFSNFVSLSVLQGANYILPLITFPYLVRVLGVEKFGLLAFATATIAYFQILTDYGFNLSATRDISIHRENKEKVEEIFSSVMIIKFGLLILSFILLIILVFSFDKFRKDWEVFVLSFGMVVGQVLFPLWFFQGMEKMKYITILNILSKLLFTVAIFVFVKSQADYWKVPLLSSLGFILAGVLALWIVFREFGIRFRSPKIDAIKYQLIEGWHIFISTVAISLYTTSRIFFVGVFTNDEITGKYAIAERLMGIVQTFPLAAILQAIYPWLSNMFKQSKKNAYMIMQKLQKITIFSYLLIVLICYILSDKIILLITGHPYEETITAFRILLLAVFFINANAFRVQFLLISGYDQIFSRIHIFMGVLGLFCLIIGLILWSYIGAAFSIVITEFFIFLITLISLKTLSRRNLWV